MTDDNVIRRRSRWAVRIATVRGIPVRIHASFLLLMAFLGWRTLSSAGLEVALIEQLFVLAVFFCVALHELGHATVAVRNGVPISGITLYPFGGVARMAHRPPQGVVEVLIAAAGPAVNLVIAGILLALTDGAALNLEGSLLSRLVAMLFWANVILAGFNLLPAFPLDGGRVLRGLLTLRFGWVRATVWAASVGQIGAIVLIVVGLAEDFWLVLAGLLVLPAANAELRYALALRHLADRRVCDLMRRELVHIDRSTSISEAAELSVSTPISDFLVTDRGRPVGYLSAPRLWAAVRSDQPGTAPVSTISVDLAGPVPSHADVESAIGFFEPDGPAVAPVVDEGGAAIGVAVRDDLMRAAELARHATRGDS